MTKGSSLLVVMNMKYLRNHNEEVMKEIWEDHKHRGRLSPHDVALILVTEAVGINHQVKEHFT